MLLSVLSSSFIRNDHSRMSSNSSSSNSKKLAKRSISKKC